MDERVVGVDEVAVGGAGLGRPSAVVPLIHKSDGVSLSDWGEVRVDDREGRIEGRACANDIIYIRACAQEVKNRANF